MELLPCKYGAVPAYPNRTRNLVLILFHRYTGRGAGLIYSQLPHLLMNCIRYPQCAMYDATLRAFLEHITLHGRTQLVASIMI